MYNAFITAVLIKIITWTNKRGYQTHVYIRSLQVSYIGSIHE